MKEVNANHVIQRLQAKIGEQAVEIAMLEAALAEAHAAHEAPTSDETSDSNSEILDS